MKLEWETAHDEPHAKACNPSGTSTILRIHQYREGELHLEQLTDNGFKFLGVEYHHHHQTRDQALDNLKTYAGFLFTGRA